MNCKSLTLKIALLSGLLASMSAMASTTFTMRIPLRELAVSTSSGSDSTSGGTVNPSGTGGTTTPVEPVPEPTAPAPHVPQQYTLNPSANEVFTIPADATAITYQWYLKAVNGRASADMYNNGAFQSHNGCSCSATWGTYTDTSGSTLYRLVPGHTYRFNATEGTLTTSKLTYTQ